MGNACCHSTENPLLSCLSLINVKIKIHKTIILPRSLTLREHRLKVFKET
jgi:hypothetical protein